MTIDKPPIVFITYTKAALQYATIPQYESQFLDWLNSFDNSSGYERETYARIAVACCPKVVHEKQKHEAIVLKLVKDEPLV